MTTTTKVFVAQLLGLPVFGPDGESIGKIRDIVVALRTEGAPRVLGLVVELATRRRIFVPMLRVTSIEHNVVTLATGSVNLRRFHSRPNEVLVIGQLLDARVTIKTTGAAAVVLDIAMQPTRTRDWVLCRVAVRQRIGRRLGRHGPVQVLLWDEVEAPGLTELTHEPQSAVHLLALFDQMRATDVAAALHDLPAKRRHEVADALDDERLADVIQELPDDDQKDVLSHLDDERAADILEAMDPDDAADLLAALSEMDKNRLLELMEPDESEPVRRLLVYPTNSAGGMMTSEPIVLPPDASVAEALARVRNPDLTPALASMVFVCRPPTETPTGHYLGCAHIQRLLREPPFNLVAGALDAELSSLRPGDSLTEVTKYFAAYNLVCAPVVDDQDHLLGAISVDDILDHLLPVGWRETDDA